MKLRLQNLTSPDSAILEHAGPIINIGRDPAAEMVLEGEANKVVSWQHARIELAAGGATLTEASASNATLLNDRAVQGPQPLRCGDKIQLGYTGPLLKVVELELPPPPLPAPERPPLPWLRWAAIGGGIAAFGVVVLFIMMGWIPSSPAPNSTAAPTIPPTTASDFQATSPISPATTRFPIPPVTTGPKVPDLSQNLPSVEVQEVGRFLALPQWGPGALLQRQGEAYPWTPLRPEGKIMTAQTLVGLPGFRSSVALDSGVHLTLWGNLPEFSSFPPILESAVMLNAPSTGVDLDLNLDHGRIHLANRKPTGAAVVRLRFLRESWTLTLPVASSEVCIELWELPPQAATKNSGIASICLGLFTKGRVQVELPNKRFDLADRSRLCWVNVSTALPSVEALPEMPDWWTKPPDRNIPKVADAICTFRQNLTVMWRNRVDV
jgi:hypothetical protein